MYIRGRIGKRSAELFVVAHLQAQGTGRADVHLEPSRQRYAEDHGRELAVDVLELPSRPRAQVVVEVGPGVREDGQWPQAEADLGEHGKREVVDLNLGSQAVQRNVATPLHEVGFRHDVEPRCVGSHIQEGTDHQPGAGVGRTLAPDDLASLDPSGETTHGPQALGQDVTSAKQDGCGNKENGEGTQETLPVRVPEKANLEPCERGSEEPLRDVSMPTDCPRGLFAREVTKPEPDINLARAALLVAQEEYDQLPVELYLARLDQLAEEVKDRLADETAPLLVLGELTDTLYRRRKLTGNRDAYYDPRNSFLNDVLDRGLGIPLTLAIVLLEVGWRLDLPLEGVNFPGHFLVRFKGDALDLLIDPFDAGKTRFEDQAQELLDKVYGGLVRLQPSFMRRAGRRQILVRLLSNLKGVYVNVEDYPRALAAVERILLVEPDAMGEVRARGLLLAKAGRRVEAADQFESYLELSPGSADAARIRAMVENLRAGGDIAADEDLDA